MFFDIWLSLLISISHIGSDNHIFYDFSLWCFGFKDQIVVLYKKFKMYVFDDHKRDFRILSDQFY